MPSRPRGRLGHGRAGRPRVAAARGLAALAARRVRAHDPRAARYARRDPAARRSDRRSRSTMVARAATTRTGRGARPRSSVGLFVAHVAAQAPRPSGCRPRAALRRARLGDRLARGRPHAHAPRARAASSAVERERRLAAAEERTRIARDLHDSAGHAINVILVQAGAARLLHERDPAARERRSRRSRRSRARRSARSTSSCARCATTGAGDGVEPPRRARPLGTLVERYRAAGLVVDGRPYAATRAPLGADRRPRRLPHRPGVAHQRSRHGAGAARVELAFGDRRARADRREPGRARRRGRARPATALDGHARARGARRRPLEAGGATATLPRPRAAAPRGAVMTSACSSSTTTT